MAVTPLDLQTNMAHLHEIGKSEHGKITAAAVQQQQLDKEADEKSRLINTRLDESKNAEKALIKDEEKYKDKERSSLKKREKDIKKKLSEEKVKILSNDDRMGRLIDVLK